MSGWRGTITGLEITMYGCLEAGRGLPLHLRRGSLDTGRQLRADTVGYQVIGNRRGLKQFLGRWIKED
jgi:hypothetical protein